MKKLIKLSSINTVETGNAHLPEHSDNESTIRPHSNIFTVTIGHALPIVFKNKVTQEESKSEPVEGSLYAMSIPGQYHDIFRIYIDDIFQKNTTKPTIVLLQTNLIFQKKISKKKIPKKKSQKKNSKKKLCQTLNTVLYVTREALVWRFAPRYIIF